jgi:hypothetical protein
MEMIVLDTLGKLHQYGHELFGWCSVYGSISRSVGRGDASRFGDAVARPIMTAVFPVTSSSRRRREPG